MDDLFEYQRRAVDDIRAAIAAGHRRVLFVAPTGSGKTHIASEIVRLSRLKGHEILFVDHRREITAQTALKLKVFGVEAGIIQAGFEPTPAAAAQAASIQTLMCRLNGERAVDLTRFKIVIIDEAHHAAAASYRRLIDLCADAIVIGLTATPCRQDGRGLGAVFSVMVLAPDVPDLIAMGRLVPSRVFTLAPPDLTGVRTRAGDYVPGQLDRAVNIEHIVVDVVSAWKRHGEDRQTVVYAVSVAHSIRLCNTFRSEGISCEHIDADTPLEERDAILARFASGETRVLTNCLVLTEGWDVPAIGCVVLARPTKSFPLLWQMLGRGRRASPGKKDLIVLDHGNHFPRIGMPDDRVKWRLDSREIAYSVRSTTATPRRLEPCEGCGALVDIMAACPHCGAAPRQATVTAEALTIARADGQLVELPPREGATITPPSYQRFARRPPPLDIDQRELHAMLQWYGQERGYKRGFASARFRDNFGCYPPWPAWNNPPPRPPSDEVIDWLRAHNRAYHHEQSQRQVQQRAPNPQLPPPR